MSLPDRLLAPTTLARPMETATATGAEAAAVDTAAAHLRDAKWTHMRLGAFMNLEY